MQEIILDPEQSKSFCELMSGEEPSDESEACGSPISERRGYGASAPPSPNAERVPTIAPMPFMRRGKPATAFKALKQLCIQQAGQDFLAICGDVMRHKDFQSNKPGVASRSRHKCGQAFDYNQDDKHLVVVSEPIGNEQYFRTWLKCEKQDGTQGIKLVLKDIRGFTSKVWVWDFTRAAESVGYRRIPAWSGWQSSYTKKEFWHYQLTEGTTYDQAMDYLYKNNTPDPTPDLTILQLGSKGPKVKYYQQALFRLGFLPRETDVDGDFGPRTHAAVMAFQKVYGLSQDGKLGPFSRGKLDQLIEERKLMSDAFDYNTDDINAAVAAEADENITPKPWYMTSQFAVLLATYILGPIALWLSAKGVIAPDQAPLLVGILQSAIVFGMAWISKQYIAGRNEISAIKARAAAVRGLSVSGPQAIAAFKALERS